MTLALAWLVCFRRALIVGALVGLVVSLLASVLSAESTKAVRSSSALTTGTEVRAGSGEVVVGSAVGASGAPIPAGLSAELGYWERHGESGVRQAAPMLRQTPAPTTLRAIQVGRGSLLTVERNEQDVELAVIEAAREFGQDPSLMLCVARHESGLDMEAAGAAGEVGAFQFLSRTFKANGKRLGYRLADITSVVAQARVTAEMWSRKQQWQWSTYAGCQR